MSDLPKPVIAGLTVLAFLLGGAAMAFVTALYFGWILMLLLGVVHLNISSGVPAIGYWACVAPALLIRILFNQTSATRSAT
jgi:hypothetical protein